MGQMACVLKRTVVPQVSSVTSTDTGSLGGGVDGDKDEIGFDDGFVNICAEEEVSTSALLNDLVEARFINGKRIRVPLCDTLRVHVHNGDLDVRALEGNDGASRSVKYVRNGVQARVI